jgi:hypothetical protein
MMFIKPPATPPSTPAEFYLQQLFAHEEERARATGERPVVTGAEKTVASVLGMLYEDLEQEEWVEGGPGKSRQSLQRAALNPPYVDANANVLFVESDAAVAARQVETFDNECTCWQCKPEVERLVLQDHGLLLSGVELGVDLEMMLNDLIEEMRREGF